jgi:hypothetical protein
MAEVPVWPVHSLLAQFRPEPGWELDRACFAAYSADVRVVTAALLALAGSATEPELGSLVQLVQAIRRLRGRVTFVVQRGRIHWPRNLPKVAALLDRFLFEADCDERQRSWHPKFAVMRWRQDGAVVWRAWLGSRNLTRDLSRDAGVLLSQAADPAGGQALPEFARAAKALQGHLPARAGRFSAAELDELAAVRWAAPKGVGAMHLHWLDGTREMFPAPASQRRVIIICPFVDAKSMEATCGWLESQKKPAIVASEVELAREASADLGMKAELFTFAAAPEDGLAYEPVPFQANVDAGDAERELDRSDEVGAYHAKLIYLRSATQRRLWLGSANLTQRAWRRNFEIVAELTATGRDPWGPVLEDLVRHANRFELPEARKERKDPAEELRKVLCVELECHQERDGARVTIVATKWPTRRHDARRHDARRHDDVELRVGLPWADRAPIAWPWGTEKLVLGELKLEECSDFLLLVLRHGEDETGWLMQVPFKPALKEDRDRAAVASYLGPDGYLRLISEELQPGRGSAPPWDAPHGRADGQRSQMRLELGLPTLEGLLRLSIREPERLKAVAKTVAMLEQEAAKWSIDSALGEEQRRALDAFRRLWKEVGAPLTEKFNGADA